MAIQTLLQELKHSFLHFVFPAQCLYCEEVIPPNQSLFCSSCLFLLELINPKERCLICFGSKSLTKGNRCSNCLEGHSIFTGVGAAFDYVGPAAALIKKLKYGNQPYLAQAAAAFLVAQWGQLDWPLPDAIIPVPISFTHWIDRGYNQSALLAQHVSYLLNRPVWDMIGRKSGDFSQAALSLSQRKSLDGKRFRLKKGYSLEDKKLLMIDDVMTSGSTLKRCAEILVEGYPTNLYGLTFCRAI